jgi:hypothetical protein
MSELTVHMNQLDACIGIQQRHPAEIQTPAPWKLIGLPLCYRPTVLSQQFRLISLGAHLKNVILSGFRRVRKIAKSYY